MNLDSNHNNVNRFKQYRTEFAKSCHWAYQTEINFHKFPENSDLLLELRDAQDYKKSVSETQDLLLQEITQSDVDLVEKLYWRSENGDEDFYIDDEFSCKMEFLSMALFDGKYPPNIDENSLDTEVEEDGFIMLHEFREKVGRMIDIAVNQELEQRKKEIQEAFWDEFFEIIEDDDRPLYEIFAYENGDETFKALQDPETDKNRLFKTTAIHYLERNAQSIMEAVDYEPDNLQIELKSKEILDKANPMRDFDPSKLPGVLYDFIDEKSNETQANPIMITQSALCAISASIGKKAYMPGYFSPLYPNIWSITIAPSGSFKTTALNKGAKFSLEARKSVFAEIKKKEEDFSQITEPNKKQVKQHQIEIIQLKKQNPILPIRSSAEGLMELLKDDTITGLEHNGGMIMASELAEFLQSLERTHNLGYKQLLTNIYDVPDVWDYVTKTQGSIVVTRPFITINAVSTMAWVKENIKANDISSGFFTRFLLYYPPQNFEIPPALPTNVHRNAASNKLCITLSKFKGNRLFSLSEEAREVFNEIHRKMYLDLEQRLEKTQEILGPYCKRWSPYILKIAMLLEAVSQPNSKSISPDSILGALSIVDYAIRSTVFLFKNDLGESEQQQKQRIVLEYIARKGGRVSRATLISSKVLKGGAGEYDYVLNTLESAGEIDVDKSKVRQSEWVYKLFTN